MDELQGKVTIAPNVLTTIVRLTTLEREGVRRLAAFPANVRGLLAGGATEEGILVTVTDRGVDVEVHIVTDAGINILKLGEGLQASITRAIEEMVGMQVAAVDVHVDDVVLPAERSN